MQKKVIKYLILAAYIAVIIAMATATFFRQETADEKVYNPLWFSVLWALVAAPSLVVFVKKLKGKIPVLMFHLSLVVILAGALTTKISSKEGLLHLRNGEVETEFLQKGIMKKQDFGFSMRLDSFKIQNYQGTKMPQDYASFLTVFSENDSTKSTVSMNNILKKNGYRFYQTNFDPDGLGTWLTVNYDPYGTPLTYFGYIIFALSGLWLLFTKKAEFTKLLKHPALKKGGLFVILICLNINANAQNRKLPTISDEEAAKMSEKQIVYNNRVAPFNTMAKDFLLKIYGKQKYYTLTPEQVVCGWLYRPDAWKDEKIILIKDKNLCRELNLDGKFASFADLFNGNDYKLNALIEKYNITENSQTAKSIRETDEKVGLILMLTNGKLFEQLPEDSNAKLSQSKIKAEIFYNKINFAKILFMLNLTIGFLAFFVMIFFESGSKFKQKFFNIIKIILVFSLVADFVGYVLRWYISGRIPMGNGYETMLFMSLIIMMLAVVFSKKLPVLLPFGFLISGFTLLVAFLGQKNPQITPLMPVLNSPILSAHVSTIMVAYSLLAFMFFNGIFALIIGKKHNLEKTEQLTVLSRIMLYPAEILLGIGIFFGAVWANISWGKYWSWDPKEVWALITFMVYAVPFHKADLKFFSNQNNLHKYLILAFLTVLMTYFGVNYFLGGMHSYAN